MQVQPDWEYVADRVMGGKSDGALRREVVAGRPAARLVGTVSLENGGGFIQIAFDLPPELEPQDWRGVRMLVFGNDNRYEMRLRTEALSRPWQSFRAEFHAPAAWTEVRLPFDGFAPNKTDKAFDPAGLRRIGVLAYGAQMEADLAVAEIGFFK